MSRITVVSAHWPAKSVTCYLALHITWIEYLLSLQVATCLVSTICCRACGQLKISVTKSVFLSLATKDGRIEVLRWLLCQGYRGDVELAAAAHGRLDVMHWLREQSAPCTWSSSTCTTALIHRHMEVLKWLRSQVPPCPWSVWRAAFHGHLEALQWLRSQGPPCGWLLGDGQSE